MDVIALGGGLGNQMFQYAFYLTKRKNAKVYLNFYFLKKNAEHNGCELDRAFGIQLQENSLINAIVMVVRKLLLFSHIKIIRLVIKCLNIIGIRVIHEPKNGLFQSHNHERIRGLNIYLGAWYSEKYFINQREDIKKQFCFDILKINQQSKNMLDIIKEVNSVSIHVRRGDYMIGDNYKTHGDVCTVEYYKKAIGIIVNQVKFPVFIVFSDDVEWARKNISLSFPAYYVNWNNGFDSWQDMFLMSSCNHNIIANSTFSWWAAWLNAYEDKIVIHPVSMRKDIETPDAFPKTWMRVCS